MFMCHDNNYTKTTTGEQWAHIINKRSQSLLAYTKFCLKHYNIILFSPVDRSTAEDGNDVAFIEVLNYSPPT